MAKSARPLVCHHAETSPRVSLINHSLSSKHVDSIAPFAEEPTKAPFVEKGSCPDELNGVSSWLKHESYCYLPVWDAKSWYDARLHCATYDPPAELVSIHSNNENKFVTENMPTTAIAWIGLYRNDQGRSGIILTGFNDISRPRPNVHHFADNIFKSIFLNENVWILLAISLKFVPKVLFDNIPA